MITELEYKSLALQGHNRIPLMAEAFADLETPLSLYLKLAFAKDGGKYSFLLESVVGGERFGRYSFIGLPARTWLRSTGFGDQAMTEVVKDGAVVETDHGNPLDFIDRYQKRFKVALRPGMPRFCGGLAGYFGYDTVRHIEKKLAASCPPDSLGCPDIMLLQTEELAVIDNLSGKLYLMVYTDPGEVEAYANGKKRLREIDRRIRFLTKRLEIAEVTDPSVHLGKDQVFFGATVTYVEEAGAERTVTILGIDEADSLKGEVTWISPIARALIKAREGDVVKLVTPLGVQEVEVLRVLYPQASL